MVKNLPAMQETWLRSLGWEDPLEEGMATYSSILAWRIPMDRGAWRATVHGVTKSQTQLKRLSIHIVHKYFTTALLIMRSQRAVLSDQQLYLKGPHSPQITLHPAPCFIFFTSHSIV